MEIKLKSPTGEEIKTFSNKIIIRDGIVYIYRDNNVEEYNLLDYPDITFKDNSWLGR